MTSAMGFLQAAAVHVLWREWDKALSAARNAIELVEYCQREDVKERAKL